MVKLVCIVNTENNWICCQPLSRISSFDLRENSIYWSPMNISEPLLCSKFYTLLHLENTEMRPEETFPQRSRDLGREPRHTEHKADWNPYCKWAIEKILWEHRIQSQSRLGPRRPGWCASEPEPPLMGLLTPPLASQAAAMPILCLGGRKSLPSHVAPAFSPRLLSQPL